MGPPCPPPQLVAAASAAAYPDPRLRRLMAASHRAFRNRRSLLLAGLRFVRAGGDLGPTGGGAEAAGARRLVGWAPTGQHWLRAESPHRP